MTFGQYIENPMGKANAVFAARDAYKAEYMEKFDTIYMREAGKIDRYLYYDKAHDAYFAHFKMPSETVKGFYYDVVIRFYTNDNAERVNSSLRNYEVQFFSNDPAFIYTYLYVFRKLKMLIDDLTNKCPRASLTQAPEQRNAYEVPGYVKSIYFAYILMNRTDLFLKTTYHHMGRSYSKSTMLSRVMSGTDKMEERREKEARQKAQERKTKQPTKTTTQRANTNTKNKVNIVSRISPISHKRTGNIRRQTYITKKAK